MAKLELTRGSLPIIMQSGEICKPILQVLGSKKFANERYCMILSDGCHAIPYALFESLGKTISKYSIVQLNSYLIKDIHNENVKIDKKGLVIMELDVLQEGNEIRKIIGNPVIMTVDIIPTTDANGIAGTATDANNGDIPPAKRPATIGTVQANKTVATVQANKTVATVQANKTVATVQANKTVATVQANKTVAMIWPIAGLSKYTTSWTLKALVTNKSQLKQWSNSRGNGCLFTVDLLDDSGQIKCTAFREMAEKYHSFLQVDKMYYIRKCQIKIADRRFSSLNHDYELIIIEESVIEECNNIENVVSSVTMYNFVRLDEIKDRAVGTLVDVIGVCTRVSELQEVLTRSNGTIVNSRDIYLLDQSNYEICLVLWGKEAVDFTLAEGNPIVVIRGAKIRNYIDSKNITTTGSAIKINPEIPSAYTLKTWYNARDENVAVTNLSTRIGSDSLPMDLPWMSFKELFVALEAGSFPSGGYFQLFGSLDQINNKRLFYTACPQKGCYKKVSLKDAMYKCERCNKEFPDFKYRLLTSVTVIDATGDHQVSMFNDVAEKVFNATAQQIGDSSTQNNDNYLEMIMQNALFIEGVFKLQAKKEKLNNYTNLEIIMVDFEPIKPEHNKQLITEIEKLTGLKVK